MVGISPALSAAISRGREHLGRRPVVLLTLSSLLGIIWADWALPPLAAMVVLCLLVAGLALFSIIRSFPAANLFLLLAFFLLGATLHTLRITPTPTDLPPGDLPEFAVVEGTVLEIEDAREDAQVVLLGDLTVGGKPLARRASVRLQPFPVVRLAQRVTLGGVWLARTGRRDDARDCLLFRRGIHAQGGARQILQVAQGASARRTVREAVEGLRGRMLDTLTAAMPGPDPELYARLLASMVYGSRAAPIPREIKELFRRTGTIHLLVVSGAQVSIIAFSLIFLVRGTRRVLPVWGIVVITIALVALTLIAGLGVSVERAVAMTVLLLGSFAWGRKYDFPTALSVSALGLCLLNTATVFDLGAQLTYACCLGVYLAAPRLKPGERQQQPWSFLSFVGWATLGAWLFASPLLIATFNRLVVLAGLANLVAVPLSVALLYVGLAAIGLGMIWLPLAVPLCGLARLLLELMLRTNTFCDSLPLGGVGNLYLSSSQLMLWYALVLTAFWLLRSPTPWQLARGLRWQRPALAALCVLSLGLVVASVWLRSDRTLRVEVLDVGAGQCVLVRVPGGGNVLLDAGTEVRGNEAAGPARRTVLPFLALRHVRSLQAIVLSHPHEDHCNLAADIMQAIPTQKLLVGPEAGAEASWPAILQVARARGVQIVPAQAGGVLSLAPDCELEFLEPQAMLSGTADDANNNSLVERLVYGQVGVLLPADLQAEGEQRLLQDYRDQPQALRANVLVAAHHASVYSDTPAFVEAVAPEVVLISCGAGSRRPRPEALRVFERLGVALWRTDLSGALQLSTDGRTVKVEGSRR